MNDVEKKFRESLRHHEVTPPPAVWGQLSANLAQKRKRKAVVYWRVAAAGALLLLGTLTLMVLHRSEPAHENVTRREQLPTSDSKDPSAALAEKKVMDSVRIPVPSGEEREASTTLAGATPVTKKDDQGLEVRGSEDMLPRRSSHRPAQSPVVPPTPQPDRSQVAALPPTVPEAANPSLPTAVVPEVLSPTALEPGRSASEELALLDPPPAAAVTQGRTVTVIYKPGNRSPRTPSSPDQDTGLLSKTLSFLEDVKKNGPTYSELRSAKSALIENVFSRDPDKQQ